MSEIIGCCGLSCNNCDIFKATKNEDDNLRIDVYKRQLDWGHGDRFQQLFGRRYTVDDIHCNGCPITSEHNFWYIANCNIRICAQNKNLENCAFCTDYPCAKLQIFFDKPHVGAKKTLDKLRNSQ